MAKIDRYRGDTAADRLTVQSPTGGVQDITSCTFKLTVASVKNPPDASTQVFQIAGTIFDALNGIVDFIPTGGETDVEPGEYWYDVEMIGPTGQVTTLVKDEYEILQDITK
jgi:hypothetical protein